MKKVKINVDIYSQIQHLYEESESQRFIAKQLNASRQIIKKYYKGNTHLEVHKSYTLLNNVITDAIKTFVLSYFQKDREKTFKIMTLYQANL